MKGIGWEIPYIYIYIYVRYPIPLTLTTRARVTTNIPRVPFLLFVLYSFIYWRPEATHEVAMAVAIAADPSFRFRWNPHMSPTLISTIFSIGCADPLPPISSAPSKGPFPPLYWPFFSPWILTATGAPFRRFFS